VARVKLHAVCITLRWARDDADSWGSLAAAPAAALGHGGLCAQRLQLRQLYTETLLPDCILSTSLYSLNAQAIKRPSYAPWKCPTST
jgi:hypothetical protein